MTTLATPGAETLDRRRFSMDEIARMQESGVLDPDEKFELIDGEIVPMSPQNMPHMLWKARLARWLYPRLPAGLELIPEGTLLLRERPAMTFETDLIIFRPRAGARAIKPDMVELAIEISDTTAKRDLAVKAPRYAAAGVRELWVLLLAERATQVFRTPSGQGWAETRSASFAEPIAPLFDADWALILADLER